MAAASLRCRSSLPIIAAVQVDQRSPCRAVPHAFHQLSEVAPGIRDEDVSGMAQVVQTDAAQASLAEAGSQTRLRKLP